MSGILLEHIHGAAIRVDPAATAFRHRAEGYNFLVLSEWPNAADDAYVNYLADDEHEGRVSAAYGANYARLQQVKRQYDPDNAFRLNQNIAPA